MHNLSLTHHLGGLTNLPTAIVWGDQDRIVPRATVEAYARSIPGAKLTVIAGSGHRPEIERPEQFLATVRKHFEKN
jgi:pimeloyl-ACP methyl ester carboxylesterase